MLTLDGLIKELTAIRNFLDQVEVKGQANRAALSICYDKCNSLIDEITAVLKDKQNQNGSENGQNEMAESKEG